MKTETPTSKEEELYTHITLFLSRPLQHTDLKNNTGQDLRKIKPVNLLAWAGRHLVGSRYSAGLLFFGMVVIGRLLMLLWMAYVSICIRAGFIECRRTSSWTCLRVWEELKRQAGKRI